MDKVHCIVVGGGPAGAACAYGLSKKGIETVLIERGRSPGEKNVASFVLFTDVLESIVPSFSEEAPLERCVTDHSFLALGEKDYVQFQSRYYSHFTKHIAFTAFRSKFDEWFAGKAKEAGAELITARMVTDLLIDDGRVVGIKIGDDELLSDVVVGADGVHSVVARKAGLVADEPARYMLGIKEVLDLPSEVIDERFQLKEGEGAIKECFGYPVHDMGGVFSLYTNIDSISLAIFGPVESLKQKKIKLYERLQQLKEHPYIDSLIKGASLREYQAHILSDGGRVKPKDLYADGVLLCGEAGGFMSSFWIGVPPAMLSGLMAAETISLARERKDYSAKTLQHYLNFLDKTALPRMLKQSRKVSNYLVKAGRRNLPTYSRNMAEAMEGMLLSEVTFVEDRPFPFLSFFYFKIGQDFVPRSLRGPIRLLIKVSSSLIGIAVRLIKRGRGNEKGKKSRSRR
jgi:electron transfer flavoprotein-quinone oxidoreductase